MAFSAPDGLRIELCRSRLPERLVDQLENESVALLQRAAAETAACGNVLIAATRVRAAGRLALLRIERLLGEDEQAGTYAASLLVVLDDEVLVEVTVSCADAIGGDLAEPVSVTPLVRVLRVVEEIIPGIRFPVPGNDLAAVIVLFCTYG